MASLKIPVIGQLALTPEGIGIVINVYAKFSEVEVQYVNKTRTVWARHNIKLIKYELDDEVFENGKS